MATKTQKSFRKQMAQIQKEMEAKENNNFFSYIENDHIENYYKPKKKRKAAAISLGSIVSFLFLIYSAYTLIKPLLINNTANMPVTTIALEDKGLFSSKQKKIADYLNEIQKYEKQLNKINLSNKNELNSLGKYSDIRKSFIETNNIAKSEMENIILSLSNLEIPKEMADYHSTLKTKYDVVYEEIIYCLELANSNNIDYTHLNYLINKQNLLQKQQTQQMMQAFDKVGIKYNQNENEITYWYNN